MRSSLAKVGVLAATVAATFLSSPSMAGQPPTARQPEALPRPDHVVVVVMENKRYDSVVGHPKTPYISALAQHGANFTQSYAETHPSQPNYLALFSGSTQGISDNSCPHDLGNRPNLGRQLLDTGRTFVGYSEDLPRSGFRGCSSAGKAGSAGKASGYVRRHNPWVNFANLPATTNQPFSAFPRDYSKLPTVAFVVPNLCDDMHDCPKAQSDAWLRRNLDGYIQWANSHNSLLILTFDEDNKTGGNRIATIILGQHVRPGQYATHIDHYSVLRTVEDLYGLAPLGTAAARAPIADCWV